jgi:hypothetical protein
VILKRSLARFLLTLCLTFAVCDAALAGQTLEIDHTLGVVTLADSGAKPDTIRFYNADGTLWYVFTSLYDDSVGVRAFPNHDFKPLAFHPDYFILCLAATRRTSDGYDVIVNQETGLTKHLPLLPFLRFRTWEEHVLSVFALEFDPAVNPIRTQPRNRAPIIPFPGTSAVYHPAEVKGDWVRVAWGEDSNDSRTGWIRWRVGTRVVVDFFYFA